MIRDVAFKCCTIVITLLTRATSPGLDVVESQTTTPSLKKYFNYYKKTKLIGHHIPVRAFINDIKLQNIY